MRELVHQMDDVAVWIVAVLAGVAAIGGAVRWIVKQVRHLFAWGRQQGERLERVDELAKELRPNGGRSIKDVTDETAVAVADLQAAVAGLQKGVKKQSDTFAIHVVQSAVRDSRLSEIEAAVTYLAGDKNALDDMAEALPIIARSTPHECDAPHHDEPTDP